MRRRLALALLALGLAPAGLRAASGGATGMAVLRVPMGARSLGMGGAFAGIDGDLDAIDYNPAGLGSLKRLEASALFDKGFEDTAVERFAAGAPLPWNGASESDPVVLTLQGLFSQSGTLELNQTNPDGSFLSSSKISAGSDMILEAGLSQRVYRQNFFNEGEPETIEHYLGATAKYLHSTLAEAYHASAVAADFGYLAKIPKLSLSVGASLLNLGSPVKYVSVSDPLPTSIRVGAAWRTPVHLGGQDFAALLAGDAERYVNDEETREQLGVEAVFQKEFAFRMGYGFGQTGSGFSLGFGVKYQQFTFDYAWVPSSLFSASHRLSVKASFDLPWTLRLEPEKVRYKGELEVPSVEELEKSKENKTVPKKTKEEESPLVPGWIR